jgi:hypothetical protein
VLTSGKLGSPAWTAREQDGAMLYTMPVEGLALTVPALAMTDRFLAFGLSADAVSAALARAKAGGEKLDANPAFAAGAKTVQEPTSGFSYVDLGTLIERAYGTFRPLLVMSLAFMPETGQYIDAAKLPSTETLKKHLGPLTYSQSVSTEGTLIQSTGPLTINQLLTVSVGSAVAAAAPALSQMISSGLDPKSLLPSGAPVVQPPASAPSPSPEPPASPAPTEPPAPPASPAPEPAPEAQQVTPPAPAEAPADAPAAPAPADSPAEAAREP